MSSGAHRATRVRWPIHYLNDFQWLKKDFEHQEAGQAIPGFMLCPGFEYILNTCIPQPSRHYWTQGGQHRNKEKFK
jgi:hypothetical protein